MQAALEALKVWSGHASPGQCSSSQLSVNSTPASNTCTCHLVYTLLRVRFNTYGSGSSVSFFFFSN